ncbi:hypothetical protein [Mucilaginibacter sp.]|nr:hypothetical protein [Mucilaginibacter sp.]
MKFTCDVFYRRALPCADVLGPFRARKITIFKALKGRHSSAQGFALLR